MLHNPSLYNVDILYKSFKDKICTYYRVFLFLFLKIEQIPFLAGQVHLIFHSDYQDDPASGFSIQVVQLTECTLPV